eukprot:7695-Eustigmatos_ZCMA.PRE.1
MSGCNQQGILTEPPHKEAMAKSHKSLTESADLTAASQRLEKSPLHSTAHVHPLDTARATACAYASSRGMSFSWATSASPRRRQGASARGGGG